MKKHNDELETDVSRGILNLKNLKDRFADATSEALALEEQLTKM